MTQKDIIKIATGIVLFFGTVWLYALEFEFMANTFQLGNLMIYAILLGLIFVFFIGRKFFDKISLFEKFMLVLGLFILNAMLMPLFASLTNRAFGEKEAQIMAFELIGLEAKSEQPFGLLDSSLIHVDGFDIRIQLPDKIEHLYIKKGITFKHTSDSIFLPMKKGFWGFSYVDLSE